MSNQNKLKRLNAAFTRDDILSVGQTVEDVTITKVFETPSLKLQNEIPTTSPCRKRFQTEKKPQSRQRATKCKPLLELKWDKKKIQGEGGKYDRTDRERGKTTRNRRA